jgi:hypothetical protein
MRRTRRGPDGDDAVQLKLRVSGNLRRRLEAEAERQGASLNARAADALELGLSLDDELQNQISEAGTASGRDTVSEIVDRLRQSFEPNRVSLVVTPRIYAELRAAADLNRRTFEEEAAHRIRNSFTLEFDLFPDAAPSPLIRRAVHQLVDVLGAIEVWLQPGSERGVAEGLFEIFKLACRAVANAITQEGGDAAVARKISSRDMAATVEMLAARALQAGQDGTLPDDTPPAAAESAVPMAALPPLRRQQRG